jgi:putative endonuclease
VCILEADLERDRLCDRRGILNLRKNYDEMLVVPHAQRRIAQNRSLMGNLAGLDQALQPRARQQRQMLRQDAVEPLSGIARTGPDSDHFISGQHLPLAGLDPAIHVFIARTRLFADSNVMGGSVYILTNRRNGTLYVGSTVNLARRIWEHREGAANGFTKRYGLSRLVCAEQHRNMLSAKQRDEHKALVSRLENWPDPPR